MISSIDFLILVPSAVENESLRSHIRRTWGSVPSLFGDRRIFFFLGRSVDPVISEKILRENTLHKDIIQAGL